jgi:hypothetical protein
MLRAVRVLTMRSAPTRVLLFYCYPFSAGQGLRFLLLYLDLQSLHMETQSRCMNREKKARCQMTQVAKYLQII